MKKENKDTFIEVTADGKQEIEEGKEPLNKDPSKEYPVEAAQSNYQDSQNEEKRKKVCEKADKLEGGIADKSSPSEFDQGQLKIGIKIEMEHTKDKDIAKEIAMDHLKEIPDYYSRLDNMEDKAKKDMKKSLSSRWELLKGSLSNKKAFMDIDIEGDEEEPQEGEEQPEEGESEEQPEGMQEMMDSVGGEEQPEEQPEDDTATESEEEEIPEDVVEEAGGEEEAEKLSDDELKELMEEMGYTAAEITHVIHGHGMHHDPEEERKDEAHSQEMDIKSNELIAQQGVDGEAGEHAKNTNSKDLKRIVALNEIEVEHERRMKELDYTMARQAREMELKYKEKELEQKLKHTDKDAKAKRDQKKDQHTQKKKENSNKHERQLVDNVVN